MSYYIYGLRIRGETECRYIGMTGFEPKRRLSELTAAGRSAIKTQWRADPDGLSCWLVNNSGNVEAFKIGKVETAEEARMMERAIIALALQLGQRLLNVQHVPDEQRIGYVPTRWGREVRERRAARLAAA